MMRTAGLLRKFTIAALWAGLAASFSAQQPIPGGLSCRNHTDILEAAVVGPGLVRVRVLPGGHADPPTPMLDPAFLPKPPSGLTLAGATIRTPDGLRLNVDCDAGAVEIPGLIRAAGLWQASSTGSLDFHRFATDPVYGMRGIPRFAVETSLDRPQGADVKAGAQGNAGGPYFFTKTLGVLVDSIDGRFTVSGPDIIFDHGSRQAVEFYLMSGDPLHSMRSLADLTGHSPMPPRWTLGFLNSQWGIDEKELRGIVAHYRDAHIPLDGFIIDYDWKAWGEDNYGEWRWNSTSGPGNASPDKFPDGASGAFASEMSAQNVHLAGILKPRVLLYPVGSTTRMMQAAAYAQDHHFWWPGAASFPDYQSKRLAGVIDFSIPAARTWFWQHLVPAFNAGMVAWWPDEADELKDPPGQHKSSLEFFYIGQALYEGQRSSSNTRVWSLNRNYYLGAARFGYAEWSGDIKTGQASMASQPARMLATLNLGEPHWSMDTGGFRGDPTPEEYARWMEFAALTPIARVHAGHNQKRQPWIFGPVAEAAATHAMRLRYSLLPYLYSAEHTATATGIGTVRPLEWIFPDDPTAAAQVDEWMLGDALLAAPVLELGGKPRRVYLPEGTWFSYADGKSFSGKQEIELPTDAKTWQDIPLFVRAGSVLATEPPGDSLGSMKPAEITLDIFPPTAGATQWLMYDDDGATYSYEHGNFFEQAFHADRERSRLILRLSPPRGSFKTTVRQYILRVHAAGSAPGWTASTDRFGPVLEKRIRAGVATRLQLPLP